MNSPNQIGVKKIYYYYEKSGNIIPSHLEGEKTIPVRNEIFFLINSIKYHSILKIVEMKKLAGESHNLTNIKSTNLMGMKNDYLDARISLG